MAESCKGNEKTLINPIIFLGIRTPAKNVGIWKAPQQVRGIIMIDILAAIFLLIGSLFSLAAAVGLVKLPDVFLRMHASTKAGTLGVGLIMGALALASGETSVILRAFAVIFFLVLTAPVAAHMLGRAAYRMGEPVAPNTHRDEWQDENREVKPGEVPPESAEE